MDSIFLGSKRNSLTIQVLEAALQAKGSFYPDLFSY